MDQVAVLHDFRKKEAFLLIVECATARGIDVRNRGEAVADSACGVDGDEGVPGPVAVCLVAWVQVSACDDMGLWIRTRGSEGVVIALDDFGAEIVQRVGDVEAVLVVESGVVRRESRGVPAEGFGPDRRRGAVVDGVAAVDELEAEIDVVLPREDLAAEDEVAAVETGEMLRGIDQACVDEGGEEC